MSNTICAISSGLTNSPIGIVRISGSLSFDLLNKIFENVPKKVSPQRIYKRALLHEGGIIDNACFIYYGAPKSYSGEDMLEIFAHGNILLLNKILSNLIKLGARLAEPGEFTKRALLNGKIDLLQAESIISIINAKTETALNNSQKILSGELSGKINSIRDSLFNILTTLEAHIDFDDENTSNSPLKNVESVVRNQQSAINNLLSTFKWGHTLEAGINIAICGKPNTGKSTLFNLLVKEERAIVTPIPGTTRDFITSEFTERGIKFNCFDTAGLRESENLIEKEGVVRSRKVIDKADIILFLIDQSLPLDKSDYDFNDILQNKNVVCVLNKTDLPCKCKHEGLTSRSQLVKISAKTGQGLDVLKDAILKAAQNNLLETDEPIAITSERHKILLEKASLALENSLSAVAKNMPPEIISYDLKEALDTVGSLVGKVTPEDVLNNIFSKFCIGK